MSRFAVRLLVSAAALALAAPAAASTPEEERIDEVVVSAAVRQGGAQDINHFRDAAVDEVPQPDTLTPEGLMGGYDLRLEGKPCAQTFCVAAEAMPAGLLTKPEDRVMVGLGFATNVEAKSWQREPLNLVAVVDKSGSMSGEPLDLVRKSLLQVASQLQAGDQLSIVLYGDRSHAHLGPTRMTAANRGAVERAILAIESEGSTNMEAGLKVGYATAFASQEYFRGRTRLMLFTDEQPNVGVTDADSFMGMAQAASHRGVGLTTIGVGVQFDAPLATKVASTRGGNLYFMRDEADVAQVFADKLDLMVSELAYDLKVTMRPQVGYSISGVYGAPGELLTREANGAVVVVVPTAFLSNEGGGLFVTLAHDNPHLPAPEARAALMEVGLSYVSARDGQAGGDALTVAHPSARPSANLRLAHALVDEYLALKDATTSFHVKSDEEAAYQTLRQLSGRLDRVSDPRLANERKMVGGLLAQTAFLSGHASEAPRGAQMLGLLGDWEVVISLGGADLRRGDRLAFTRDNEVLLRRRAGGEPAELSYRANNRELLLEGEDDALFAYQVSANHLTLAHPENGMQVRLRRVAATE